MKQHEQARVLLDRAHQDQTTVEELLSSERVADEIVGFHCQQAVEKLLKALLSVLGVRLRKTHDLQELMDLLADAGHPVPKDLQRLTSFTPYAAVFRYDLAPHGTVLDRRAALELVRHVRGWIEPRIADKPPTTALKGGMTLKEAEKELIQRTLRMVNGNREQAANILGIGERTLYRKIKEYGLKD